MRTGAMFVRLVNGDDIKNDIKYVNIQLISTIERLHFEPEESKYARGWIVRFGPGEEYGSLRITGNEFYQLVEFLPIANRA